MNEQIAQLWESLGRWSAYLANNGTSAELAPPTYLCEAIKNATKRTWVGLTEEDFVCVNQLCDTPIQSAEYVEHLLKERND